MHKALQSGILLCFGLIMGLLMTEAALSYLDIPRYYKAHSAAPQFRFLMTRSGEAMYTNVQSSNIEFIYDGNTRGYFDDRSAVQHHTNSYGFRGSEFQEVKPGGTYRVAVLGDSFTFGEGVKDSDVYSSKMQGLLKRHFAPEQGMNIEVLNFGVGGYNTEQSLFLLEQFVVKTTPDIVIVGYTLNDAEPKLFYLDRETKKIKRKPREEYIREGLPDAKPPEMVLYKLRTAQLIWQLVNRSRLSKQTENYYNSLYRESTPGWAVTRKSLKRIARICTDKKIACYIASIPLLYKLQGDYPFEHIHQLLAEEVDSYGSEYIHFVDLLPHFKGQKDIDLWVHPTDQHPNEIAHEIIAEALYHAVLGTVQEALK